MNRPYAHVREEMLNAVFNWPATDLELQCWTAGVFDETQMYVSQLVAAGGIPSAKSTAPIHTFVETGGYASSDGVLLPGASFTVGERIVFMTLSDRTGALADPKLVLWVDDAEGFPFVADGLDVLITPDWVLHRGWWRP